MYIAHAVEFSWTFLENNCDKAIHHSVATRRLRRLRIAFERRINKFKMVPFRLVSFTSCDGGQRLEEDFD